MARRNKVVAPAESAPVEEPEVLVVEAAKEHEPVDEPEIVPDASGPTIADRKATALHCSRLSSGLTVPQFPGSPEAWALLAAEAQTLADFASLLAEES